MTRQNSPSNAKRGQVANKKPVLKVSKSPIKSKTDSDFQNALFLQALMSPKKDDMQQMRSELVDKGFVLPKKLKFLKKRTDPKPED